jgi:hypothetical protein
LHCSLFSTNQQSIEKAKSTHRQGSSYPINAKDHFLLLYLHFYIFEMTEMEFRFSYLSFDHINCAKCIIWMPCWTSLHVDKNGRVGNPDKDLLAMVTDDSKILLRQFHWRWLWIISPGFYPSIAFFCNNNTKSMLLRFHFLEYLISPLNTNLIFLP